VVLYIFDRWEDGSKNPTRIINLNANKEIRANYKLVTEMVEINKSITKQVDVTINLKWIFATVEPETPTGYYRAVDLDISFGTFGTLYGFIEQ
jgi:hypothetical protein